MKTHPYNPKCPACRRDRTDMYKQAAGWPYVIGIVLLCVGLAASAAIGWGIVSV